ncbi:MAG: ArgE/DapE family deacylase [Rubellimicrobium sp.]|nr:ArgE/DapE family deacylase [Rubellimicrobium sp.]
MTLSGEAIASAVASDFDRQVDWLSHLVSFDSTRGNEEACQDWLSVELAARGYAVDRYTLAEVALEGAPGASPVVDTDYAHAVQVVATHRVERPEGRSLILQGHVDVVPPGAPELWSRPPFQPVVIDGWLHGRGSADMKGGVSAIVFALDALARLGWEPASTLHVQTVTEEECTGNGAVSTILRGYRADAVLIPESMGHRIIRAELGSVWFRLRILGKPGHALADAAPGGHAILAAQDYIAALQALTAAINQGAKDHPWFGTIPNPVKFNPGRIRGGDWLGSVPSWCELDCRLSVLPGQDLGELRDRITACVAECAAGLGTAPPRLDWIGYQADGHVIAPGGAAEAALERAHRGVIGTPLEPVCLTATSDGRIYDHYHGMPTLVYGGIGRGLHAPDEAVDLTSLRQTTEVIARFIADWCGLRERG